MQRLILRVFRMFVREAKRLRVWRAAALDSQAREFLRQLTIELYFEKGFDNAGRRLATPVNHINHGLLSEVQREFERSPEWRYFEAARLTVASTPAPPHVEPQPVAAPAPPTAASEPAREVPQVNNVAAVIMFSQPDRPATKRNRKPERPRVNEPMSVKPPVDKATSPKENVETPGELSYDKKTQAFRFRRLSFTGIDTSTNLPQSSVCTTSQRTVLVCMGRT